MLNWKATAQPASCFSCDSVQVKRMDLFWWSSHLQQSPPLLLTTFNTSNLANQPSQRRDPEYFIFILISKLCTLSLLQGKTRQFVLDGFLISLLSYQRLEELLHDQSWGLSFCDSVSCFLTLCSLPIVSVLLINLHKSEFLSANTVWILLDFWYHRHLGMGSIFVVSKQHCSYTHILMFSSSTWPFELLQFAKKVCRFSLEWSPPNLNHLQIQKQLGLSWKSSAWRSFCPFWPFLNLPMCFKHSAHENKKKNLDFQTLYTLVFAECYITMISAEKWHTQQLFGSLSTLFRSISTLSLSQK